MNDNWFFRREKTLETTNGYLIRIKMKLRKLPKSYGQEFPNGYKFSWIAYIKRYLGYSNLSQAEFNNLVREATTAPDLQECVEKTTNFERTIENMTKNSEIELFIENMINIIGKVHKFKLDKELERTKIELDQDLERTRKHYQGQINQVIKLPK